MMRRCILGFSSCQSLRHIPRQITTQQIPSSISSRKEFSVASQQNASQGSGSTGKLSASGSHISKFFIGSVAVGAAVMAAYQTGYLSQFYVKEGRESPDSAKAGADNKVSKDSELSGEQIVLPDNQEPNRLNPTVEHDENYNPAPSDIPHIQDLSKSEGESQVQVQVQVQDRVEVTPSENTIPIQEKDLPDIRHGTLKSEDQSVHSGTSYEGSLDMKNMDTETNVEQNEGVESTTIFTKTEAIPEETAIKSTSPHRLTSEDMSEDALGNDGIEPPNSLLDAYFLREKAEESTAVSFNGEGSTDGYEHFSEAKEASVGKIEDSKDAYISKDGKLVFGFLQAIHAAEERQAELDARVFLEEKRILKEKYEKELKDARASQLKFAEEAAILDKELNKERTKAAATVMLVQEEAEENLKMELERKENEAKLQLKKVQELANAELAAAIASEKASQIEKMAEANLHINALCMAFYARSEEVRQSHSVHKLALGALALEDALSKGLPIQREIDALHTYLEGIDKDSLLDLVLSSLPGETLKYGTDTQLQLNQKFDALKGTLRHFSLIPPGGGGILAHTLAHIASWLKVREDDQSGDGIESVINRVESFLAKGKLTEAADALEGGVSGSQAEELIGDWVRRARNRAITEQALSMLQSYATSISLT